MSFSSKYDFDKVSTIVQQGYTIVIAEATLKDETNNPGAQLVYKVLTAEASEDDSINNLEFSTLAFPSEVRGNGMQLLTLDSAAVPNLNHSKPGKWKVISDGTYVYLFRALSWNSEYMLYANRYLLVPEQSDQEGSGINYRLVPKREARYQVSGRKDTPNSALDPLAYQDLEGRAFLEPVLFFDQLKLEKGWFTITLTPSDQGGTERWLFFTLDTDTSGGPGRICSYSFLRGIDGWPDLRKESLSTARHFQLVRKVGPASVNLEPIGEPASLYFSSQENTENPSRDTITAPRIMLASRVHISVTGETVQGLVTVDFMLATDGVPIIKTNGADELEIKPVNRAKTALEFDGNSDYVEIPPLTDPQEFTFECWLNPARSGGGTKKLMSWAEKDKSDSKAALELTWNDNTGNLQARSYHDGTIQWEVLAPSPSAGLWHHVALRCASAFGGGFNIEFVINGNAVGPLHGSYGISPKGPLRLGGVPDSTTQGFIGILDEVRLWKSARTDDELTDNMFQELKGNEAELIGYWKFDDAYSDAPSIAVDSSASKKDGAVYGAKWVTRTAPVYGPNGQDISAYFQGLSPGMGLLDFEETRNSEMTDPCLLNGADGLVHLYAGVTLVDKSKRLGVLQYDTSIARSQYNIEWQESDSLASTGTLRLIARQPGPNMNQHGGSTPAVELSATQTGDHFVNVTLTAPAPLIYSETFEFVPSALPDFALVINGLASNDPLNPRVQCGDIPFYDYSGERQTIALTTTEGNPILLVTARDAKRKPPGPSALKLVSASFADAPSATLTVSMATTGTVTRTFTPQLAISNLPSDVTGFLHSLTGSNSVVCSLREGTNYQVLSTGSGNIFFISDLGSSSITYKVSDAGAGTCTVTVTNTYGSVQESKWTDVSTKVADFVHTLNTKAPNTDADLRTRFVVVAANVSSNVIVGTAKGDSPLQLAPFFNVIGYGAGGSVAANTYPVRPPQKLIRTAGYDAPDNSSLLFQAAPPPEFVGPLKVLVGTGQMAVAGNFGGWVPTPPACAGDFSKTQAYVDLGSSLPSLARLQDDFSFECWFRLTCSEGSIQRFLYVRNGNNPDADITVGIGTSGHLFAGAGSQYSQITTEFNDKYQWTHLAAICSNNHAVAFNGSRMAVVNNSENFGLREVMSIDGRFLVESATEGWIVSKSDDSKEYGSYQLYTEVNGNTTQLCLKIWLADDSENNISYVYSIDPIKRGISYYFGVSVRIQTQEEPGPLGIEAHEGGIGQSSNTYSVSNYSITRSSSLKIDMYVVPTDGSEEPNFSSQGIDLPTGPRFTIRTSDQPICIGARSPRTGGYMHGKIGDLRLWSRDIGADFQAFSKLVDIPPGQAGGLEAHWRCDEGMDITLNDSVGKLNATLDTAAMWTTARLSTQFKFFLRGREVSSSPMAASAVRADTTNTFVIGAVADGKESFSGQLDEIRLWESARTAREISDNMSIELTGSENKLAGYWPISTGSGSVLKNRCGSTNNAKLFSPYEGFWWQPPSDETGPPHGNETPQVKNLLMGPNTDSLESAVVQSVAVAEYGRLLVDDQGITQGILRRFYAYVGDNNTLKIIGNFNVGHAELEFIGQAQSNPSLIGYIEGAPPVPRKNLTRPYYESKARYQAYMGATSVSLVEDSNLTYSFKAHKDTGFDSSFNLGIGMIVNADGDVIVAPMGVGAAHGSLKIDSKTGLNSQFSFHLGFISGAQVSINTKSSRISSMELGGNWDEEVASRERQYLPDNLGYALVESEVVNVFAMRLKRTNSLIGMQMVPELKKDFNIILFPISPKYTKQGTLDGMVGFDPDADFPEAVNRHGSYYKPYQAQDLEAQILSREDDLAKHYGTFEAGKKGRRQGVAHFTKGDPVDPSTAIAAETNYQYDWENDHGKRSLVNTYVWTAGGGLFAEEEQTMITRQESHGGSYSFTSLAGIEGEASFVVGGIGPYIKGASLFGGHIRTSVTKQRADGRDFGLRIKNDTEAFLAKWLPNTPEPENNGAAEPGKVDAYRFKTFYLSPERDHFHEFFSIVVEQNWLDTSTSADAIALREARTSPNHVWRVLHRVTYVSRVPLDRNQAPAETASRARRTIIDREPNALLLRLVRQRLSGPPYSAKSIAEAVDNVLTSFPIPWWQKFLKDAAEDISSVAAINKKSLRETVLSYMIAFFQE